MSILVLLHGFGRYPDEVRDLWPGTDHELLAVRSRCRIGPGAYRWFGFVDQPDGSVRIDLDEERVSRAALVAELEWLRAERPDRPTVLFGHSQGGMLALAVLLLRPDLVDCCAVRNSRVLPETLALLDADPDLAGTPVYIGHGVADPVVPVERGRLAAATLARFGATVTHREDPGGHDLTPAAVHDVAAWLRDVEPVRRLAVGRAAGGAP